ncbi:hypothetical protein ABLE92_21475, partial [Gordonia sp. VNQ95]
QILPDIGCDLSDRVTSTNTHVVNLLLGSDSHPDWHTTDSALLIVDSALVVTDSALVVTDSALVVTDSALVVTDSALRIVDSARRHPGAPSRGVRRVSDGRYGHRTFRHAELPDTPRPQRSDHRR